MSKSPAEQDAARRAVFHEATARTPSDMLGEAFQNIMASVLVVQAGENGAVLTFEEFARAAGLLAVPLTETLREPMLQIGAFADIIVKHIIDRRKS